MCGSGAFWSLWLLSGQWKQPVSSWATEAEWFWLFIAPSCHVWVESLWYRLKPYGWAMWQRKLFLWLFLQRYSVSKDIERLKESSCAVCNVSLGYVTSGRSGKKEVELINRKLSDSSTYQKIAWDNLSERNPLLVWAFPSVKVQFYIIQT